MRRFWPAAISRRSIDMTACLLRKSALFESEAGVGAGGPLVAAGETSGALVLHCPSLRQKPSAVLEREDCKAGLLHLLLLTVNCTMQYTLQYTLQWTPANLETHHPMAAAVLACAGI